MRLLHSILLLAGAVPLLSLAAAPGTPASQPAQEKAAASRPRHPPLVITEKTINPKHADAQLVALARKAKKDHQRILVEFGATWCVACELVKPVFWRPENQALFRGWQLVQVDVDQLPEGPVLGIPFDTIPFFMKLDGAGHVVGTLRGSDALSGHPTDEQVDAAFARFLGT